MKNYDLISMLYLILGLKQNIFRLGNHKSAVCCVMNLKIVILKFF
jgi:hypothetical protein